MQKQKGSIGLDLALPSFCNYGDCWNERLANQKLRAIQEDTVSERKRESLSTPNVYLNNSKEPDKCIKDWMLGSVMLWENERCTRTGIAAFHDVVNSHGAIRGQRTKGICSCGWSSSRTWGLVKVVEYYIQRGAKGGEALLWNFQHDIIIPRYLCHHWSYKYPFILAQWLGNLFRSLDLGHTW